MPLSLTSPAFPSGGRIPVKYTRDGQNVSPPLAWHDTPEQARSFATVVEDPDAPSGTFRHWAIYNIGPGETGLREGASKAKPGTVAQGVNDFGNGHYDGPQPPKGHGPHHYYSRLAALDVPRLDLPTRSAVEEVWKAARPHIIAEVRGDRDLRAVRNSSGLVLSRKYLSRGVGGSRPGLER